MRPSLTDIQQGEQYLHGHLNQGEAALFEARQLTDPALKANTYFLRKTFFLLRLYNRKKLKQEAEATHNRLFADPAMAAFQQTIRRLFKQ